MVMMRKMPDNACGDSDVMKGKNSVDVNAIVDNNNKRWGGGG
jgi:hypothetical protein